MGGESHDAGNEGAKSVVSCDALYELAMDVEAQLDVLGLVTPDRDLSLVYAAMCSSRYSPVVEVR